MLYGSSSDGRGEISRIYEYQRSISMIMIATPSFESVANALELGAWADWKESGATTHWKSPGFELDILNATNAEDEISSCTKRIHSTSRLRFCAPGLRRVGRGDNLA
jgi:hypothetical protein